MSCEENIEEKTVELTPEDMAKELFSQSIDEIKENPQHIRQLILESSNVVELFQILLIFLMEGIQIKLGDISKADLSCITTQMLLNLSPWLEVIGFKLQVKEFKIMVGQDYSEEKQQNSDRMLASKFGSEHYCDIITLNEKGVSNMNKTYTFKIGPKYYSDFDNLNEIYALFSEGNRVFKINFDWHFQTE